MSVSSTERLDELDALLPARPAGRNIIGFAIEAIKELRKDVVHWREARRSCIEAGDMMKTEIERLRKYTDGVRCPACDMTRLELGEARAEIERLREVVKYCLGNYIPFSEPRVRNWAEDVLHGRIGAKPYG